MRVGVGMCNICDEIVDLGKVEGAWTRYLL